MKKVLTTILLSLVLLLVGTPAYAVTITTIILSGSDTVSLHEVTSEAAAAYNFLSNGGVGNVLVVNDFGASNPGYAGGGFGATTSFAASLPASFAGLAGIMFASPGGCCSDPGASPWAARPTLPPS